MCNRTQDMLWFHIQLNALQFHFLKLISSFSGVQTSIMISHFLKLDFHIWLIIVIVAVFLSHLANHYYKGWKKVFDLTLKEISYINQTLHRGPFKILCTTFKVSALSGFATIR
jgi:hypothetical protein